MEKLLNRIFQTFHISQLVSETFWFLIQCYFHQQVWIISTIYRLQDVRSKEDKKLTWNFWVFWNILVHKFNTSLNSQIKSDLTCQFSSVTQSCLTLWLHGLQHARPPCPSPTPRVYSNSCPLSWWCHPTIWSSVIPFSSHLQSFPASGSFLWVSSSHQVVKVLEFQLQHQSFQWIIRTYLL